MRADSEGLGHGAIHSGSADQLMRQQGYGSVESSAVSQRTFHAVAVLAVVLLALSLAIVAPRTLSSADNHTVEGATPIASLPFRDEVVDASITGSGASEPLPSCARSQDSFWYVFSPEEATPLSVRVVPGQDSEVVADVALAAWTLEPDGTLSETGCADARGLGAPEQLVIAAAGQRTHYLQVGVDVGVVEGGTGSEPPTVSLTLLVDTQHPEHDLFDFARTVGKTPFSDVDVDAIDARREPGEPDASCAELVATTWYTVSAENDAILSASVVPASVDGNAMDVAVAVYGGDALGALTETSCADAGGVQEPERIEVPLEGGEEYAIQVGAVLGADAWPGIFSLSVAGRQAIELDPIADTVFGAEPLPLIATADSGLPVSFETSGPCRVLDGALVTDGAGSCTVTASQPGDPDWAAAPEVALDIDIARAVQHIAFGAQPDTVFGAEPLPLSATADSGLPVSFETSGPCRVLDGALVADGAGSCTVTASQPGDPDWEPASAASIDIDIAPAEQAIELAAIEGAVVGEPLPLSAIADSGLPVSFETSGACVVEGTVVRPIGSGTCTITASQPGDTDWEAAEPATVTARIGRGRQTVELAAIEGAVVGEPLPLTAIADSGLPVSFEASGPCRVLDDALILDGAGRCAITASQPGDIDWQPAAPVTTTVRVDRGRQAIVLDPIGEGVVGGSVGISATADSGLPVTFETDGPCHILDGELISEAAGTCLITVSQPGDADWAPAPDVTLEVDIARAAQAIEFEAIPDSVFGAEPLPLNAAADSGMPVSFETSGPCHILDGALVSQGAGICAVSATQPGDDAWQPAEDVRRVFRVARAPQEITFETIGPRFLGEQPIELGASASSGLPVTYSASGSCVVDAGMLAILEGGSCSVSAFQAGDADWAAARQVSRSFPITAPVEGGEIAVAVDPPGTLVGPGAEISSALEPGQRDEEYYAIALESGDVLELSGRNGRMDLEIMGPRDVAAGSVLWGDFELDDGSGTARWLAQDPGIHTIRIRDLSAGSGTAYDYTLRFDVVADEGGEPPA